MCAYLSMELVANQAVSLVSVTTRGMSIRSAYGRWAAILDRRNRRVVQVHRLVNRIARLVVFPEQMAGFVIAVSASAGGNMRSALEHPLF